MNEYIYMIRPTRIQMLAKGPTSEEAAAISEHFEYLKELHAKGKAVFVGRTLVTDESAVGIVIYNAVDDNEARSVMENDPAIKKKVMSGTFNPFKTVFPLQT